MSETLLIDVREGMALRAVLASHALARRVQNKLAALAQELSRAARERAAFETLSAMSERELRDIGLTRFDLESLRPPPLAWRKAGMPRPLGRAR